MTVAQLFSFVGGYVGFIRGLPWWAHAIAIGFTYVAICYRRTLADEFDIYDRPMIRSLIGAFFWPAVLVPVMAMIIGILLSPTMMRVRMRIKSYRYYRAARAHARRF